MIAADGVRDQGSFCSFHLQVPEKPLEIFIVAQQFGRGQEQLIEFGIGQG
jgi:hypothetical protein